MFSFFSVVENNLSINSNHDIGRLSDEIFVEDKSRVGINLVASDILNEESIGIVPRQENILDNVFDFLL